MVEDGVDQVRLFRAPISCPSTGGGTRQAGGTVAESLVGHSTTRKRSVAPSIGRGSIFGQGGGQLDPRRARCVLDPCARASKARTRKFLREKLISNHGLFSSHEGQQGAANGQDSWVVFQGSKGLWTAECWLARRLYQLKASTAMDLIFANLPTSALRVALRNLGLLIKTNWSMICSLCC